MGFSNKAINVLMLINLIQRTDKLVFDALARECPRLPCAKGKRSAVAGVNGSPVDCQSRDRTARRRLARSD